MNLKLIKKGKEVCPNCKSVMLTLGKGFFANKGDVYVCRNCDAEYEPDVSKGN